MATIGYLRVVTGTGLVFKDTGGDGTITMTSLAAAAARQSAKYTFASAASRAAGYAVMLEWSPTSAATAGGTVDVYWSASVSATAGTQNAGGCSGSDAAYTGYSSNLTDSLKDLIYVGSGTVTAFNGAHKQLINDSFSPPTAYGQFVVVNNMSVNFSATAADHQITLLPNTDIAEDA